MQTSPTHKDQIRTPFQTPRGEVIYELFGLASEHGRAEAHSLAQVVIPPGKSSLPHRHQVCEESYFILQGRAQMSLDEREFEMTPGQACLIIPGQTHQISNTSDQDLEFLAICAPAWYPEDTYLESDKS